MRTRRRPFARVPMMRIAAIVLLLAAQTAFGQQLFRLEKSADAMGATFTSRGVATGSAPKLS